MSDSYTKSIFFISILFISLSIVGQIKYKAIYLFLSLFIILLIISHSKKEEFKSPLEYNLGNYDNLELNSKDFYKRKSLIPGYFYNPNLESNSKDCSWLKNPCSSKLHKNIYVNVPFKLSNKKGVKFDDVLMKGNPYEDNLHPPVDGVSKNYKKMFMFTYNKCSPECCPSDFSCDKGCLCLNQDQRDYINSRGRNRFPSSKHNMNF